MSTPEKALIVPINSKNKIFIQDRAGHKPPPWGFFGGSVELGETALQAVLREAKEELDLDLNEDDLVFVERYELILGGEAVWRTLYLYPTEQETFIVLEGAGGTWVTLDEVFSYIGRIEMFEKAIAFIQNKLPQLK